MAPKLDIHGYNNKLQLTLKSLKESKEISKKNKELILKFDTDCKIKEKLSIARRLRLVSLLQQLARDYFKKDFDKVTKKDVERVIKKVDDSEKFTVWTRQVYWVIIKKFFSWLEYGDKYTKLKQYPEKVAWINTHIKSKDIPKIRAADILTEEEVKKLIKATDNPRDRAFISLLYELGARISEIGNLTVGSIHRGDHGYIVDVNGKTGQRTPIIILGDNALTEWLNTHPHKDDPNAPLWVSRGKYDFAPLKYNALKKIVFLTKERAGIKKRIYPHLFRHSRVTHVLINGEMNESQAKIYFGWVPQTKVLATYTHLTSQGVNDKILEFHGLKRKVDQEKSIKPIVCPHCDKINDPDSRFCKQCSKVLNLKTAVELDEKIQKSSKVMAQLLTKQPDIKNAMKDVIREMIEKGKIEI